ncbi:MATE family efflux transporter [Clostridiaceae bacterium]|nr:MATE family efflux transporter [Clostridium sp.]NBI70319.1 MATE family efflux transporter [Clostridiaceae bacterium]
MVKNLTEGKPLKLLFFFSLPMLLGNLFQQLYNMVDSIVVGNFVGADALAAVGASFPVTFLAVALAAGLSMGCNVVISQLFGANRIREMKVTVSTALIGQFFLSVAIMIVGGLLSPAILSLLKTPDNIMADSRTYLQIYFGGAVFLFIYNTLNGIYNALGDSKTPLYFLIFSTLANIYLDLRFVIRYQMGVAGVAWATLIAQGICAGLSLLVLLIRLKKMPDEEDAPELKARLFDFSAVKRIAHVGVPSMIQQSIVSLSMLFMQGLVNSYGSVFIAGYTAATKIDSLAMLPNMNFSNAMSSYTAQNIGAGKPERVKEGYKASICMVVVFSVALTTMIFLFGPNLLNLFMDSNINVDSIGYGMSYMRTVSSFYILMGILFVSNGLLRGAGDMGFFMLSSLGNLFCRVAIAYTLASRIGPGAIWWSIPIGWLVGSAISFSRYRSGKWEKRRLVGERGENK